MSAITVGGSAAGSLDLLAALVDGAVVGEFAQDALQLGAVGVLQAELARDLAGADLARMRADEGDDGVPARKAIVALLCHFIRGPCPRFSSQASWRLAGLAGEVLPSPSPARAPCWRRPISAWPRLSSPPPSWPALARRHRRLPALAAAFFGGGFLGAALRLAAALGDALVDQRDGFRQRDGVLASCRSGCVALTPPAVT